MLFYDYVSKANVKDVECRGMDFNFTLCIPIDRKYVNDNYWRVRSAYVCERDAGSNLLIPPSTEAVKLARDCILEIRRKKISLQMIAQSFNGADEYGGSCCGPQKIFNDICAAATSFSCGCPVSVSCRVSVINGRKCNLLVLEVGPFRDPSEAKRDLVSVEEDSDIGVNSQAFR